MNENNTATLFQGFGLAILFVISCIYMANYSSSAKNISALDGWLSSGYEVYIDGNLAVKDYTSMELFRHCRNIIGYPNEKKITCEIKSKSSLFAFDEALSQGYAVFIDGEKSEGISYTGEFLKENYNASINDEARQILCVKKPEVRNNPIYLPIPIRY